MLSDTELAKKLPALCKYELLAFDEMNHFDQSAYDAIVSRYGTSGWFLSRFKNNVVRHTYNAQGELALLVVGEP